MGAIKRTRKDLILVEGVKVFRTHHQGKDRTPYTQAIAAMNKQVPEGVYDVILIPK